MEGKSVILSVLIMSLVMVQIQVEARVCCPSQQARNAYTVCRLTGAFSISRCVELAGCVKVSGNVCPSGYPNDILENSGNNANECCKLGCASSVCGAMTTFHNSGASEVVDETFERCAKTCATFCNKGFIKPAAESA